MSSRGEVAFAMPARLTVLPNALMYQACCSCTPGVASVANRGGVREQWHRERAAQIPVACWLLGVATRPLP
jgi:hypothetical protein